MSEDKNKLIKHAEINWSDQSEPFSAQFEDVYFNTEQGLNESLYVFLQGNNLQSRWLNSRSSFFSIAETGFGTGLNFLLTCLEFHKFRTANPEAKLQRLHFSSFEKYPLNKEDLHRALSRWPALKDFIKPLVEQYPLPLTGCHRITLDNFNITLDLWFGDVKETLPTVHHYNTGIFDCWYLDGFAPSKNPEMWSEKLFSQIAAACKHKATIATFTAAGFVRRGLINAGFKMHKRKGYGKKREMLIGDFDRAAVNSQPCGPHYRAGKTSAAESIAVIGGGIAGACISLALIKRGYKVSLYCKDAEFAVGASGNQQGALYPLLNDQHNALSQFFANSFLFARNYVTQTAASTPFAYDFSGLLQLYYDQSSAKKLDKILQTKLPQGLVCRKSAAQSDAIAAVDIGQQALFYPLAGWLSPKQMVNAVFDKAKQSGNLTVHFNHKLESFKQEQDHWKLEFSENNVKHDLVVLTTGFDTLQFKQCEALPLSAARGQVSHVPTNDKLGALRVTLCHEGYLTPVNNQHHCMGASFKRHLTDETFSQQEQIDNKHKLAKCIVDKDWVKQIDIEHQDANIGIRCTTRDHFPYAGALPDYQASKEFYQDAHKSVNPNDAPFHDNLFILTGLGSRGLCTAPLLAEMLAGQINKEPLPFSCNILNAMQGNRQWLNYLKKSKALKF
ncbi:bifunctional tRNA (5-methylaminomethyl-2-thiouridine)(34)-methyltransferase MnmD/FAD-dependent 5-carboxymethylaminomethyl-2-thiouridine(34) oxidoreductase MnmC [Psychromonas ossibalaenae]|uniref:bifunctional tRNA (5-methylaminomethyl-2-thiouridine)(34)-methyltransferase MnmD/FAD-dependent 5-carboxymethylaminomethyl-2-thiouridine(34) oxidoreductase MnmC n=1 Tax=Psychromonas ossibalaenae TaxID=444922 RepID=UPI00036FDAEB|nr:bifunctional tRNA (5-methylaminomethyl-2-thiouridine)(34)-methyltransferase MnmD/FAD-dependent 5-carboxymethylaminomethyl-2-thiouridine(34) oxidoreductase MnmC [Psychromonas ossibalaenae]